MRPREERAREEALRVAKLKAIDAWMKSHLVASHPAWHLPLGYQDGAFGAARVPSGAYLGDCDLFLFLVGGNRDLDDPTTATRRTARTATRSRRAATTTASRA